MTFKKLIRFVIPSVQDVIKKLLEKELLGCKNVLDLGCGKKSPLYHLKNNKNFKDLHSVGVDIFSPYILENVKKNKIHSEYINKNIFEIDFSDKSFDVAILFDVIEHFKKDDFLNFLPKLERIAKKIIIITPNGFVDQEEYENNPYQIHLSGWDVKDMTDLGFKCYGLSGLKGLQKSNIKPTWLKTILCDFSQLFLKKSPQKSFHLIAIKNL